MYVLDEDESAPGLVTCLKDYNGVTRVYLGQLKFSKCLLMVRAWEVLVKHVGTFIE